MFTAPTLILPMVRRGKGRRKRRETEQGGKEEKEEES